MDAAPSKLTVSCLEDGRGQAGPDRRGEAEGSLGVETAEVEDRKKKLKQQQQLDIDPRALFLP